MEHDPILTLRRQIAAETDSATLELRQELEELGFNEHAKNFDYSNAPGYDPRWEIGCDVPPSQRPYKSISFAEFLAKWDADPKGCAARG